ncbi:MAG: T9SS type A sorting domain-containing protein [Bacteroidales bacterium]|nr:T9SS type A sorting domain-containing protein [Bacteroidales bacterium]
MTKKIFVLLLTLLNIFTCYSQSTKEHPFLLTSKDNYVDLFLKQDTYPWSKIKNNAELAYNKTYTPTLNLTINCVNIQNLVAANALLYILDPDNKATYVRNAEVILDKIEKDTDLLLGDDQSSSQAKAIGSCYFVLLIAMDVMYDDLDIDKRTSYEAIISDRIFKINISSWKLNAFGLIGVWELYTQSNLIYALRYYPELVHQISPDGVGYNGGSYPAARLNYDRFAKTYFLDVLDFTGIKKTYTDDRLIKFYEWLYGYSISPFRLSYTFGDSGSDRWYRRDAGFRAGRFSDLAKGHASWAYQSEEPGGTLLSYLTIADPPGEAITPISKIFPNGGAWFLEGAGSQNDLAGAMWNAKKAVWHSHSDINALHLCAYGEHVLRNSGYDVKIDQDILGFSWDYRHNDSRSGNTATINGESHVRKFGGGIVEGFTENDIDYAKGLSNLGTTFTLPFGGNHIRYFQFVHPKVSLPGYWIVFDELESDYEETCNVYWHPNAHNFVPVIENTEYNAKIAPISLSSNEVQLSIFLGTKPESVRLKDGVLANMSSGDSFVGKYIDAKYNLDANGKAMIATILFPHDKSHAKSTMKRFEGMNFTGVSIKHSAASTIDYAITSSGEQEINTSFFSFMGDNAIIRMNNELCRFYFASGSKSIKIGGFGFKSDSKISLYSNRSYGSIIASEIQEVTFYNPGIIGIYINNELVPEKDSGEGWLKVDIPAGTHKFTYEKTIVSIISESELSNKLKINFYPNPAKKYVMINMESDQVIEGSISVYNLLGQVVWHEHLPSNPNINMRIDISSWNSGTFLVQTKLGREVVYRKLIVSK